MKKEILLIIALIVLVSFAFAQTKSVFPQDKINKVIFEHRKKNTENKAKEKTLHHPKSFEANRTHFGFNSFSIENKDFNITDNKDVLYIGPQPDTFFICSDYVQNGDIVIFGQGILVVDSAKLTLSGHLYAQDEGQAFFRNDAHLHFNQFYVGQYFVWLVDNAKFEATDAIVDANGVMHYAQLHDRCTYIATNTYFPDWTFRKVFNTSTLILEDVNHVGDIMVDDSCYIHFTRCDTLMPWFQTPDGSVVNIQFPDPDYVDHFEFSDNTPGIDNIHYTFIADSCTQCWWSLETLPGCDVTINNSIIRGSCVRMFGSDTINIDSIQNYTFHANLDVALGDRHLEYNNSYIYWWNWYPYENVVFNIDSCSFGEMIGSGESKTYATNCIHDGATIMLSAGDSAFVSFADGISYSFVGTFKGGTFLFVNSSIIPLWPYQSTNLAHDSSRLLAVNSYFEYEPEAMDSALVMFAAIDSLSNNTVGTTVDVIGSAWIDAGPLNPVTFDRYKLYWAAYGDSIWALIKDSTVQIYHDILAEWNTSGLIEGEYDLRLIILNSAGDSLTGFKTITLLENTGMDETGIYPGGTMLLQNYPNPFNSYTTICYQLLSNSNVRIKIYNLSGKEVRTLVNENQKAGKHSVVWDGKDDSGERVSSGVYFYQLKAVNEISQIKKLLFFKTRKEY